MVFIKFNTFVVLKILDKLRLSKYEIDAGMFTEENIKFVKTSETIVKEKCDYVLELSDKNKKKLKSHC